MFDKRLIIAAIALAPFLAAKEAQAAKVLLSCSGASTCYFTFFIGTAVHNWTLQAGTSYAYNGVQPGDTYCRSTDGPNDPNTCRRFTLTREMLHD